MHAAREVEDARILKNIIEKKMAGFQIKFNYCATADLLMDQGVDVEVTSISEPYKREIRGNDIDSLLAKMRNLQSGLPMDSSGCALPESCHIYDNCGLSTNGDG